MDFVKNYYNSHAGRRSLWRLLTVISSLFKVKISKKGQNMANGNKWSSQRPLASVTYIWPRVIHILPILSTCWRKITKLSSDNGRKFRKKATKFWARSSPPSSIFGSKIWTSKLYADDQWSKSFEFFLQPSLASMVNRWGFLQGFKINFKSLNPTLSGGLWRPKAAESCRIIVVILSFIFRP